MRAGDTANETPRLTLGDVMSVVRDVPEADVDEWSDIDRIDVRPAKGVAKVRCVNYWEVQVDLSSGRVLSSTWRRSDLIESLHDGSFFADAAKLWVFLPNGLILLGLWVSGMWLWYLPFRSRRRRLKRTAEQAWRLQTLHSALLSISHFSDGLNSLKPIEPCGSMSLPVDPTQRVGQCQAFRRPTATRRRVANDREK